MDSLLIPLLSSSSFSPFRSSPIPVKGPPKVSTLLEACATGDLEAVVQYHSAGGDINSVDYDDRSALHIAAAQGRLVIAQWLLQRGGHPSAVDRFGRTPLFEARQEGHHEIMRALHKYGAKYSRPIEVEAKAPGESGSASGAGGKRVSNNQCCKESEESTASRAETASREPNSSLARPRISTAASVVRDRELMPCELESMMSALPR